MPPLRRRCAVLPLTAVDPVFPSPHHASGLTLNSWPSLGFNGIGSVLRACPIAEGRVIEENHVHNFVAEYNRVRMNQIVVKCGPGDAEEERQRRPVHSGYG